MGFSPRLLKTGDASGAIALSSAAGWNQTPDDWLRMLRLSPDGCFGIDCDETLVATATVLRFEPDLAWIGMVLTHRDYQRRGFARALMQAAIDAARVATIKLDATDQGRPLYASLGFVDEQPIERWKREARPFDRKDASVGEYPADFDRCVFGANRAAFVSSLPAPVLRDGDGFALSRPGTRASYLGPVVAPDREAAERLVCAMLDDGDWFWDLLPSNAAARELATRMGFVPVRHLVRMRLGPPVESRDELVYAIAGFEAG